MSSAFLSIELPHCFSQGRIARQGLNGTYEAGYISTLKEQASFTIFYHLGYGSYPRGDHWQANRHSLQHCKGKALSK
jgi:hypothetical protein